ncbi:putative membrane protein [Actinoalloteichus hoggarensis]|uniref:Bacterial membrane flanked domain protein n=1 Tax=Actinoalloteichus hoggarensis TaxID=1470176 RepID=A0A221VZI8_9PSEU|nr:PH domain-containing protein [Actinoalloteichus hoggarensis]ASO18939.1 Bacterial membrane flanked domain protein [Actinoalloteichus hoggarensis]MBB5920175.1 putative membrane protein [Actinoalloteichus hoggarensis]
MTSGDAESHAAGTSRRPESGENGVRHARPGPTPGDGERSDLSGPSPDPAAAVNPDAVRDDQATPAYGIRSVGPSADGSPASPTAGSTADPWEQAPPPARPYPTGPWYPAAPRYSAGPPYPAAPAYPAGPQPAGGGFTGHPGGSAPPPPEAELIAAEQSDQRLDARMIAVKPLNEALGLLPVLILALVVQGADQWQFRLAAVVAGLLLVNGLMRWLTTRYRITEDQVVLRTGWLFRTRRAVPRERIRTVDLTARLMHRVFGLTTVKIGTGGRKGAGLSDEMTLDSVSRAEAERLRQVLLHRAAATAATASRPGADAEGVAAGDGPEADAAGRTDVEQTGTVLSRLDPRWLRFAPLTLAGLTAVGVLAGLSMQWIQELSLDEVGLIQDGLSWLDALPVGVLVGGVILALLLVSTILSLVVYAIRYWNYVLTRETDGTIRVRRGLLTTRAVSLEEKRLRGVELQEPLLLRGARAGQVNAVAVGISAVSPDSSQLLPPAPVDEAHRVAAGVSRQERSPTQTDLSRHPAAALSRRLVRAVVPTLLLAGGLWALALLGTWPSWPAWVASALIPAAVLLGVDRYRSLGHSLDSRYLVTRHGSLSRNTVALEREGIIGWNISRSVFQRSAGLVTLTATTAAGGNAYSVIDVGEQAALGIADEAVPDLLQPFLIGAESTGDGTATHQPPVGTGQVEHLNSSS